MHSDHNVFSTVCKTVCKTVCNAFITVQNVNNGFEQYCAVLITNTSHNCRLGAPSKT